MKNIIGRLYFNKICFINSYVNFSLKESSDRKFNEVS